MLTRKSFRHAALPVTLLAAGASALAATTPALAADEAPAQVRIEGDRVHFTAALGQANHLKVTVGKITTSDDHYYRTYTLKDVWEIQAGSGCVYPETADYTRVQCTLEIYDTPSPLDTGVFELLDEDDEVVFENPSHQAFDYNKFWLGSGDDTITSRQEDGGIDGSAIWGGPGDDVIVAGPGGDNSSALGGTGDDVLRVSDSGNGGAGDDILYATDGAALRGDAGDDRLYGSSGADSLYGGPGNDSVWGKKGADTLWGNSGNDRLYGGPGTDTIHGGPGKDVIRQN
ncbi:hypothetical protein KIH74_10830 [Kineosporia sp. J2-2]|uniref:Calcium-binding protein n=1 Tax=Kineosporia corallincola TaxID=2835133 RepID=A0ABS5TEF1_9ACTN|nr:calcium-binding protein [Kineosporia corallincola]MBT0769416.1 hypothetical protein [Kineosporia corallincola]